MAEGRLLVDITGFISAIKAFYQSANAKSKRKEVQRIMRLSDWHVHYVDKQTGRKVLSESNRIEHEHEHRTAVCLAQLNYDVIFAPPGQFERGTKRFDIYLLRDTIILKADLKYLSSKNPLTIAKRIKEGSEQATRLVLEIASDIHYKMLIEGLRSGIYKNTLIKEILLIYKRKFYRFPTSLIMSKHIFDILKSEKGYT